MNTLFVFFENQVVGQLRKDAEGVLSFQYSSNWLDHSQAFPISLSLPLQKEPFKNYLTKAFFENLMPEGDVLHDLKMQQNTVEVFEFMQYYGQDCAGAMTIHSHDSIKTIPAKPLKEIDLNKIYSALKNHQSIASEIANQNPGYLSIAGAQDKFPCIYQDGKVFLPQDHSPTTHIVKAPIWRFGVTESVFNEYFCMQLAKRIGLTVANCSILEGPYPLFIAERYDRQQNKDQTYFRLHQEDLCQAQGILAENKYENKGGPSLVDNYQILKKHINPYDRFFALEHYLKWVMFNLIIGNNDSHSKNISLLLHADKGYTLAPFYDLLSTAVYPKLVSHFSFKIGGRDQFSKIGKNQLLAQEKTLGLSQGVLLETLQKTADSIQNQLPILLEESQNTWPQVKVFNKISNLIQKRMKSLHMQKAL
ncbi:type II toxin-antitoxin system HipA family toxin [bacterium]|nr:type II toxin-antitoxin system HipA family toxin [bacterium]